MAKSKALSELNASLSSNVRANLAERDLLVKMVVHAEAIVAPVIGVEEDCAANGLCQFEAHLRITHEIAVLLAVVRN